MAEAGEFIPELPEELTEEWMSGALGKPIKQLDQEILGQGQGFLGDIIRLHLKSDAAEVPATLIAKLPKKANRTM
ncbi:MAG: hypothetical protein EP301_01735, partial [Gammaproteobacteria bacterium]